MRKRRRRSGALYIPLRSWKRWEIGVRCSSIIFRLECRRLFVWKRLDIFANRSSGRTDGHYHLNRVEIPVANISYILYELVAKYGLRVMF